MEHSTIRIMSPFVWMIPIVVLLIAGCGAFSPDRSKTLLVGAASSMEPLMEELGAAFTDNKDVSIVFTYGATGNLTSQIEQGAPIDVFVAADSEHMKRLDSSKLLADGVWTIFAMGELVLVLGEDLDLPNNHPPDLLDSKIRFIALANPELAPYGNAGQQSLKSMGDWESIKSKVVYSGNVRQALQYVESGNADAALVPRSLSQISKLDSWLPPQNTYSPIEHTIGVIKGSTELPLAREFAHFIISSDNHTIINRNGYLIPSEITGP